jgi:hypothetical protein
MGPRQMWGMSTGVQACLCVGMRRLLLAVVWKWFTCLCSSGVPHIGCKPALKCNMAVKGIKEREAHQHPLPA